MERSEENYNSSISSTGSWVNLAIWSGVKPSFFIARAMVKERYLRLPQHRRIKE
jgi:hypothetical protein